MSVEDPRPDEALQRHLHAAAGVEPSELSDAAHTRITARLLAEVQRPEARPITRRFGWANLVSVATLTGASPVARRIRWASLAAAAMLLAVLLRTLPVRHATEGPLVCALPSEGLAFVADGEVQRLALGGHGVVVAEQGAEVRVATATPCELRLAITRGVLAADVHGLRPGRVVIETPYGAVVVRGTRLSVSVSDALEVSLVSGVVDIETENLPTETLTAGHAFKGARGGREVRPLGAGAVEELGRLLSGHSPLASPAEVVAPPVSSARRSGPAESAGEVRVEPLRAAERARRRGDEAEARRWYERSVAAGGADAEVALLRWARFELTKQRALVALSLLERHRKAFSGGALEAEALWLELSVRRMRGDHGEARALAQHILARYPETPQASAARKFLERP